MTYKHDELRELIPLYLNGRLSEKERQEFEDAVNSYPELKRELMEFTEIKDSYKDIEYEIPQPSDTIYKRIVSNVKSGTEVSAFKRKGYLEQIQGFLKGLFLSPRVSWGVVAVQVVIILFMLVRLPEGDKFRTLTSEYALKGEEIRINVVFEEDAREREIREVLNKIGAFLIGGPSAEGLYIIQIKDNQDIEVALKVLRNSKFVRFVERAF